LHWATGILVFVVLWWLVLFAVLPWGVRTAMPDRTGNDPGAPERPRLALKCAVTTAVTGLLWLALNWIINSGLISFRPS
jgi:predicted secreted protein